MSSPEAARGRGARGSLRRATPKTPGRGRRARNGWVAVVVAACVLATGGGAARAERRVALVIGNLAYQHAPPLRTPGADAAHVAELLRKLDFSVVEQTDVDKIGMERAIRRFSAQIDGADVALFYYSGHGAQVGDVNFLVPVSARVDDVRNLPLDTIALQDVSLAMRQAGAKVQLLFLDACRDNPFEAAFAPKQAEAAVRGLARVSTVSGSLVVFSTAPGQVAQDGTGEMSPFTTGFLRYAGAPNLDIRQVLTRVRAYVAAETDNQQVPWDDSSLLGDFYLVPKRPPPKFDKLAQVEVAADLPRQALHLTPPRQPEGGAVNVRIEQEPAFGRLILESRPVESDETLAASDFARLAYESSAAQPLDSFSYRVDDAWGNSAVGLVSITRSARAATAPVRERPPLNLEASAVSLVGLGPNLIFRKSLPPPAGGDARPLELTNDPPFGQIVLGDRVIEKGRSIDVADLARLRFEAPVGSEGKHFDAQFAGADGSSADVRIGIDAQLTDCDRLAGDRLDAQGVGEGILAGRIDTAAALPACELAVKARPGFGRFNYEVGRVYAALGRDADAVAAYRKAADLGYIRAQWALGYHDVYVPPTDLARGREMLERAAAAGDVYAIHTLGQIYYEGRGVPKDVEKAKALFETAARRGHTFSMNSLGRMYERGEAVPVDHALAHRFWEESAARGDIYGLDNLGFVYLDGIDVGKDPAKALSYFRQASDLGHPEAPNNIGRLYVLGIGVPVDLAEARRWYLIGADRGDAWAAYNLGELFRLGKGGPADGVRAGYYYARAAASINRLEPAQRAREQLAGLDATSKAEALRLLVGDIDPASAGLPQPALAARARQAMTEKGVKPIDTSSDAVMVGAAQALWLARSARADLF